jgi:alpha-beta hydrolase superfamily lysophospholipase
MKESSFEGTGGLNIAMRSWTADGAPRAVLAIVPGFNSHSGYYNWVAEQFIAEGVAVYSVDLRGRGKSDGERYYVADFNDYVSDVAKLVDIARSENPGLPVFILGHSAGGVVACMYTLEHQSELAGLICESFAFQVPAPDFALAALKGLAHVFPHAHVLKLKNKIFSRDPKAVEAMDNDPLIANETQPTQTVAQMVIADDKLKAAFPQFTLPVMIIHGTEDKATRYQGSPLFYDTASSPDKTIKLYEGHFHDLLNDVDKELVIADIKAWVEERIPVDAAAVSGSQ